MYFDFFCSPIGKIHILVDDSGLRHLSLCLHHPFEDSNEWVHAPHLLKDFRDQILEFLQAERKYFSLPIAPKGTEFQQRVWRELQAIPYGETRSYADIAQQLNSFKAYRAVGMANNVNPIPLVIPCHRVIGSNGDLVGYRYGLPLKQQLLSMEKNALGKLFDT